MTKLLKTPETINQLLLFVSGVKNKIILDISRKKLNEIERTLIIMKNSPELQNNCSLDFKIDNPEYYINQINNIIEQDHNII